MHACVCMHACVSVYVLSCVSVNVCIIIFSVNVCGYINGVYMRVPVCMYVIVFLCVCMLVSVCMSVTVSVCMYFECLCVYICVRVHVCGVPLCICAFASVPRFYNGTTQWDYLSTFFISFSLLESGQTQVKGRRGREGKILTRGRRSGHSCGPMKSSILFS